MSNVKALALLIVVLCFICYSWGQSISIAGFVKDGKNKGPLEGAIVELILNQIKDTTDTAGAFELKYNPVKIESGVTSIKLSPPKLVNNGRITFSIPKQTKVSISTYNLNGKCVHSQKENMQAGKHSYAPVSLAKGIYVYRINIGKKSYTLKFALVNANNPGIGSQSKNTLSKKDVWKRTRITIVPDTLIVSKAGYISNSIIVSTVKLDTTLFLNKISDSITIDGDSYTYEVITTDDFNGQSAENWTNNWSLDGGEYGDNDVWISDNKLYMKDIDKDSGRRIALWYKEKMPKNFIVKYKCSAAPAISKTNFNHWSHMSKNGASPIGLYNGNYSFYKKITGYFMTFTERHARLRKNPGFNLLWEDEALETQENHTYEMVFTVYDGKLRQYIDGKLHHTWDDSTPIDAGWFAVRTLNTEAWWDDFVFGEIVSARHGLSLGN